jgi:hypothetical protein
LQWVGYTRSTQRRAPLYKRDEKNLLLKCLGLLFAKWFQSANPALKREIRFPETFGIGLLTCTYSTEA